MWIKCSNNFKNRLKNKIEEKINLCQNLIENFQCHIGILHKHLKILALSNFRNAFNVAGKRGENAQKT